MIMKKFNIINKHMQGIKSLLLQIFQGKAREGIALVLGVLIMSFCLGYLVLAWTEPTQSPPGGNVPSPLNVGSTSQTKTGNLTLPGLYLNAVGNEGNIYSVNIIQGYNDLILYSNGAKNAPIYLEGSRVVINNDAGTGNVGIGTANPPIKLTVDANGVSIRVRNSVSTR